MITTDKNTSDTMLDCFEQVETTKRHIGHTYSVGQALTITVLGLVCGLKNASQIHQWSRDKRVGEFLAQHFGISQIPCYCWLLGLLKTVKPESLSLCFSNWVASLMPENTGGTTISVDGKTIRFTGKMQRHKEPLHIVSAQLAEMGMTFGQKISQGAGGEIPAVRELLSSLQIKGCLVVADALHCQKESAQTIVDAKADYLLNVKDNQKDLKAELADYLGDAALRAKMQCESRVEKNRARVEERSAYVSGKTAWIHKGSDWPKLAVFGALHTRFTTAKGTSEQWHYYISSRKLTAAQLLHHARMEWTVETMHWFLDVHFGEDFCRVEDENVQQNLNTARKIVLNGLKTYKLQTGSKKTVSQIALDCLLDPQHITDIVPFMLK